jgi:hypothetical protein
LSNNTTGSQNTSVGSGSLSANTIGSSNVSIGLNSLHQNIDGASNTATGYQSLLSNINGSQNTASGMNALEQSTGSNNTALGYGAGSAQTNYNQNTFIGYNANVTSANIGFPINNSTAIGANTTLTQSNTVILGDNNNVGIGTSATGHNTGAERYLTISSGSGSLSSAGEATSLELIGGTTTGDLQNRIDFIARATDGNNYSTGRIEMTGSNDESGSTKYGIMKFHTKAREAGGNDALTERMSIDNYGKIKFGKDEQSYVFPTSRGDEGQILSLSHDSPGELVWNNPTSSPWDVNGSNISRSSGYVGIGTSSPSEPLHIKRTANAEAKIESSSGLARLILDGSVNKAAIDFYNNGTWGGTMGYSVTSDYLFWTESGHGTIMVGKSGNIGIGNTSPTEKLEVTGNTKLDGDVTVGNLSGTGERNVIVDASGKLGFAASNSVGFLTGMSTESDQNFEQGNQLIIKLQNGSTTFNDGGGYNPSDGKFTAPTDGIYHFNVNISVQIINPNEDGLLQMVLQSPGGKYGEAIIKTLGNSNNYYYYQISLSQTLKLTTGQSTWISLYSSQNSGKVSMWTSSFSGHLIK